MHDCQVVMLASGSKGNSALIRTAKQNFLVDMGISCRALTTKLKALDLTVQDLDAVFLTHEHIDHVRGLATFTKNYQVPIFSSENTWRAILAKDNKIERHSCRLITDKLQLGDIKITSFAIPHDAIDPHGYTFINCCDNSKCSYLTDTGFITDIVREAVSGSDTLILEANHDVELLKNGSYPYQLKQRILSTRGHLSNEGAGWFLNEMDKLPQKVILAHLSEENNRPQLALDTVKNILDTNKRLQETELFVASQKEMVADFPLQTMLNVK